MTTTARIYRIYVRWLLLSVIVTASLLGAFMFPTLKSPNAVPTPTPQPTSSGTALTAEGFYTIVIMVVVCIAAVVLIGIIALRLDENKQTSRKVNFVCRST